MIELCLSFDQCPVEVAQRHLSPDTIPEFIIKHIHMRDPFSPSGPPQPISSTVVAHYSPESENEIKVNVGETLLILDRKPGWAQVDCNGKKGWIPLSCIAERHHVDLKGLEIQVSGHVLGDYDKNALIELSVKKGEQIKALRFYQHWLYVDTCNEQGWIPSCFVSLREPIHEQVFVSAANQVFILFSYYREIH
jgi:SH3-like domain-containing protein